MCGRTLPATDCNRREMVKKPGTTRRGNGSAASRDYTSILLYVVGFIKIELRCVLALPRSPLALAPVGRMPR